ncbi:MAG: peptidylprolyl isomerase [Deltaproteobacteria bacterium]|nr:peptidylprolyl isomerase [Deltaproteobacteria bacterium]
MRFHSKQASGFRLQTSGFGLRALGLLVALLLALPASAAEGPRKSLDGIAAIVNDDLILKSELDERARPVLRRLDPGLPATMRESETHKVRVETLNSLITDRLIKGQVTELHIEVGDAEVNAAIDDVKKQRGLDDKALRAAIESEGLSYDEYREVVKGHLVKSKLFAVRVRPRVRVTDEDVKNWYMQNVNAATAASGVRVSAIFVAIPKEPKPGEVEAARKRAGEAYGRAARGEDFARLAQECSEDPTGKSGGDLGVVKHGMLNTPLERAVFSLKEGQITEPVESDLGIYIFKAVKVLASEAKPLKEVKDEIHRRLFEEESERQFRAWVEELRKEAHVEIKLTKP